MNKIYNGFLTLVLSAILWLIPYSAAIYIFHTDPHTDVFYSSTGAGVTQATVTLDKSIYLGDTATLSVISSLNTDVPLLVSYNGTTRATVFNGLTGNSSRELSVTYDVDVLNSSTWDTVLNLFPKIWIVLIILFPAIGLAAILSNRA